MNTIPDATALTSWRKSSYSENGAGGCVEISDNYKPGVPIRDSKNPHGPAVIFTSTSWTTFVTAIKAVELPAN